MASRAFLLLLCFSQGIVAGSAWVALLTVLDLVPRLATLTRPRPRTALLETAILGGAFSVAVLDLGNVCAKGLALTVRVGVIVPGVSLLCGLFIGMLAASLAEVLNVLPVLARRLNIGRYVRFLISALALGKALGSLAGFIFGD